MGFYELFHLGQRAEWVMTIGIQFLPKVKNWRFLEKNQWNLSIFFNIPRKYFIKNSKLWWFSKFIEFLNIINFFIHFFLKNVYWIYFSQYNYNKLLIQIKIIYFEKKNLTFAQWVGLDWALPYIKWAICASLL